MSTNAIIPISSLDISKVTIGDIRTNAKGGKSIPIRYGGQNLQMRFPKYVYPMGVNVKEKDGNISYTLSTTLKGCDPFGEARAPAESGELGNLYNFILDLQELLIKTAAANSTKWFGKKHDVNVLGALMKKSISPSVEKQNGEWVPSGKYPPSLRLKVPVYNGEVNMNACDQNGKAMEVTIDNIQDKIPKRSEISLTVSPSIYVSGNGFGITWRIGNVRVCPPQRLTAADVFADEIEQTEEEDIQDEEIPTSLPPRVETNIPIPTFEEEQQERPETPPQAPTILTPPPAPAKGNRRRAAVPAV